MSNDDSDPTTDEDANESTVRREAMLASPLDPYKVRGFNDADASGGDNPTGVLGRTNGSGQTYGVQGVSESDGDSINNVFPAGVYGEATGSGSNLGVHGVTQGTDAYAVGVKAEADAASATALQAVNLSGTAISGRSNGSNRAVADLSRPLGIGNVLTATHTATPSSGIVNCIDASVDSATDDSAAVFGNARATSGRTYGLSGLTSSTEYDASGVKGEAAGSSGRVYGVYGRTNSTDGTAEPAGVYGEAIGTTGWTYGVHGVTFSDNINAAGVRAVAEGDGQGLFAESTGNTGAAGVTKDGGESGVFGINNADSNVASTGYGVRGETDSTGAESAGVFGKTTQGSGQTYGVRGVTGSTDANAAGVYGSASGDAAAVEADGHVDVKEVGLSAYRSSSQSINSGVETEIVFDQLVDSRDDFGGLDTSTGQYTVGPAGDYHVSAAAEWANTFSGGTTHKIILKVNGASRAGRYNDVAGSSSESSYAHEHISKTLYGLASGDTITVEVYQDTGDPKSLSWGLDSTYVTIDKVG